MYASDSIAAMEVIARIPRKLVICPDEDSAAVEANAKEVCEGLRATWVTELTAAALMRSSVLSLSSQPEDGIFWSSGGGWATDAADLGGEGGRWGARDVIGTLMATGSDNDKKSSPAPNEPCLRWLQMAPGPRSLPAPPPTAIRVAELGSIYAKFRFPCHPVGTYVRTHMHMHMPLLHDTYACTCCCGCTFVRKYVGRQVGR